MATGEAMACFTAVASNARKKRDSPVVEPLGEGLARDIETDDGSHAADAVLRRLESAKAANTRVRAKLETGDLAPATDEARFQSDPIGGSGEEVLHRDGELVEIAHGSLECGFGVG